MRLLSARPQPAFAAKTSQWALLLLTSLFAIVLSGCAAQKPMAFHANSISKISYDPKNCVQLPDGAYRCKDVIFTVSSVEAVRAAK
jgi:hypothetical protein